MTDRRALRLALRRLDWWYQDQQRGRTRRPKAYKQRSRHYVTGRAPRRSRQRTGRPRQPTRNQALRDALGAVVLVGTAALLLYYIGAAT